MDDYETRKKLTENILADADWAADLILELQSEIARHHKDFQRWEEMADKGASQIKENARLRELLAYIPSYETEPCRLDHHGYCQDHPGGFREGGCWVAAARAALSGEPT